MRVRMALFTTGTTQGQSDSALQFSDCSAPRLNCSEPSVEERMNEQIGPQDLDSIDKRMKKRMENGRGSEA